MKLLAVILMTAAVPALAQDAAPRKKKAPDLNEKIGRSETVTGSNLLKAECHTQAEWTQIDQANRPDPFQRPAVIH